MAKKITKSIARMRQHRVYQGYQKHLRDTLSGCERECGDLKYKAINAWDVSKGSQVKYDY